MKAPLIFISAGELSGDMHGAKLVEAIRKKIPNAQFIGLGGDKLLEQHVTLVEHYARFGGVMGFGAVFKKLRKIYEVFKKFIDRLITEKPSVLILVDLQDFNLRVAKKIFGLNIPVVYFIPPKVWAWRSKRIKLLEKFCSSIISILPF